ncbi:MAG: lipoyl synthase [Pseudomonadota bacterium]
MTPCEKSRFLEMPMIHMKKMNRLPEWLRKDVAFSSAHSMKRSLRAAGLHTVCEEARCPNMGECFSRNTATIMIMGNLCTRSCGFCAVISGEPNPLDPEEPRKVAMRIKDMGLLHAVITSVTRDDLPDGGAGHFKQTIIEVRAINPHTTIEVLTPDFEGREADVRLVCEARPCVFNHNVETVRRLTPHVRSKATYERSLEVLRMARQYLMDGIVKSGFMVGLGETDVEVDETLGDLAEVGCDVVTIGQYLAPSKHAVPVAKYIKPEKFRQYKDMGLNKGINQLFSGPLVRSSYLADDVLHEV